MSETLRISKCIQSRLWYTSLTVCQNDDRSSQVNNADLVEARDLIARLIDSPSVSESEWIIHTLLRDLVSRVTSDTEYIEKERCCIQMKQALRLCRNLSTSLQEKLLTIHGDGTEQTSLELFRTTQDEYLTFLKQNVYDNPFVTCWIHNELSSTCSNVSDDTVCQLQDFYPSLIKELLEFKLSKQKLIGDNSFECLLLLISRMNVPKFDETAWFTRLFPMMLKASDTQDLQLALYSRTDEHLFKKWCAFLNQVHMNCKPINNLNDALKVQKVLFHLAPGTVTIDRNRLVERVNGVKSHWVTDVLNICYILMINGKYNDVSCILSCTLLKPLWPVLLLKVLNECSEWEDDGNDAWKHYHLLYDSVGFLMPKCTNDLSQDSAFNQLQDVTRKNLKILKYILDCGKENEGKPVADPHGRVSVKWILHLLQHFDTLSVLKMTTNIHEQEHERTRCLLEDLREPQNVFNAYRGTLYALKAILLCDSYDANRSTVTDYLSSMRDLVKTLQPLELRVQVIENIFYLLFLRDEHFDHVPKSNDNSDIDTSYEQLKFDDKCRKRSTGFVCNKYAVRDVLHHLRDVVSATATETGNTDEIDRIDSALADAKWRLELYTSPSFTEYAGRPVKDRGKTFRTKKLVTNNPKENVLPSQESSVSDEPKIKPDDSSGSETMSNTKCRKHSRGLRSPDGTKDVIHKPLLVNFLLATKESLIIRCLWKNDYAKAQEILESSDTRNTRLNGEVEFSKALHAFRRNITKQASTFKSTNESQENSQSSALENIRQVVQEGIQSSRQTGQFETFLASQEVNLRMLSTETLNNYEILTICALDMALTVSQIYAVSLNLCEVAMKYLKLYKTFDNTEYVHFFHKFYQLLYEKKDAKFVEDILCDAKVSLSVKEYKERENFWTDVATKRQEFKESQVDKDTINKILKDRSHLPGLKILSKIATIPRGTNKYMQNLSSHLQLLHVIIPTEHALFTVSDLLKVPLHYYIGHQIFELGIEPSSLEPIAHDLQIDLAYSILSSACPVLPYEENATLDTFSKDAGCIVLNKASNKSDSSYKSQGPNQCVSEILAEFLQVLQSLSLNQSRLTRDTCKILSEHADVRGVLGKTARLVRLDLSELSTGDETLTFLVNTWNLMILHAVLTVWANDPPFNELQHSISLNSIGYLIGDLGLVTLTTLRSKLLGDVMSNGAFFIEVEELNEPAWQDLDITHDPRIVFLMANEYDGTPCIKICNTDSLNEDLANGFREYLDHYLVKRGESVIQLPEIVERYQSFISQNSEADPSNDTDTVYSINEYIESNEATAIEYVPMTYSYGIVLRYQGHSGTRHHKQVNRCKSDWKIDDITPSLLQYLVGRCWVVSYLLRRIQNESVPDLYNLKRTACLENLVTSPWVKELKSLFENNRTLAAILETIPMHRLWSHFEVTARNGEWEPCLKLINALPDRVALCTQLQCLKDKVLGQIVTNKDTELNAEILRYLYQIKDVYTLSQTVLYNINKWHVNICKNVLLHLVHHVDRHRLPVHCVLKLTEILRRVLIFNEMLPYCVIKPNETWYDVVYSTGKVDPLQIVKSLINADQFELCLEWMECQAFSLEVHPFVTEEFLIGLLKSESQNFDQTSKFFQALPLDRSIKLCKVVLNKLESIDSLRFICNYLLQYCKATETIRYRRTLLGIEILSMLDARERPQYVHLIKEPLLMLEQLLMNCKFESIQRILNAIEGKLDQADISRSSFDKIIRFYAQKSLDIRVSLQCDAVESRSLKNTQRSASETESTEFVMPLYVPTKEEWVPNDKANKCSCCRNVIFSMFNRRHHCRRCGRVICATCSQHRMQVSGYPPSVLVRVCDDCKRQTMLQAQTTQGSPSTSTFDYWRLTRDQKHNKTIREEFSFEYAPNISLCLAILSSHSEHKSYASFLLDCCDEMRRLLHPVAGGKVNPEVDHAVIIKMIRSLLVAAKVKCAKLGLNTGLSHCDSSLSQVDLIGTLIQSDCLHLIPSDEDLDEKNHTLRKLRDRLIEKEEWTLALDMSTKAGLDTQGVWTTWGKACLKVGHFDQARDKFFHCLDKIQHDSFDDWVILSYPRESETSDKKEDQGPGNKIEEEKPRRSEFSKSRPLKNPPVLTEILQILDNLSVYKQYSHYPNHSGTAQELLTNFGSFKIANRKQFNSKIYYQESLYYLLTYGSYTSILEFFLKHEEFDKCLAFTLENNLEPDLFFNGIYLYCLRNGNVERLYEAMSSKDPTLFVWKRYLIHVCHSLEKRQYLNMLYHLQLFMKDFVRAAMTCVRFYTDEASSYADLNAKASFLVDAQKHLESELQIESLNRKRRRSTSSVHGNQGILTMEMEPSEIDKHLNTISRQMEIAKFLASCEKEGRAPVQCLSLFPGKDATTTGVPTLFGNQQEKIDLAVLTILCGRNIEEGFGIAFRIMQDYNLPQQKVYSLAGHVLTVKSDVPAIRQLIKCCQTSGIPNSYTISDYVITHCVKLLMSRLNNQDEAVLKNDIYGLVRLITDVGLKINAYIECRQLKAAYLLAVKDSRAQDVRKILKESDRLGQNAIEAICIKWLEQQSKK